MEVDLLSHWVNRSLHLTKFVMGINTDIKRCADARKQTYLTPGISSYYQKNGTSSYRPDTFSRIYSIISPTTAYI